MRFGILGTGVVGKTMAGRLDGMGHETMVGTRDLEDTLSRTEPDSMAIPPSGAGTRSTRACGWARSKKRPPTARS